jgi:IS5 family transposase
MGFDPQFNERADRHAPLSEAQTAVNRERSKTRTKVEHVFGSWVTQGGGQRLRTLGMASATTN